MVLGGSESWMPVTAERAMKDLVADYGNTCTLRTLATTQTFPSLSPFHRIYEEGSLRGRWIGWKNLGDIPLELLPLGAVVWSTVWCSSGLMDMLVRNMRPRVPPFSVSLNEF